MRGLAIAMALLLASPSALAGEPHPFVQGSWHQLLEAHRGKPLIVHFWGITCAPCMVEMPKWAALMHRDAGFDFVVVDGDPVGADSTGAQSMLAKMGLANAESWRFADDFVERLRFEVDPKWQGELPLTVLVGRGAGVRKIVGSADFDEVARWLQEQEPDTIGPNLAKP